MKVIKPLRLAFFHKLYPNDGRSHVAVAAMVLFPFEQPDRLLPEMTLWPLVAEELGGKLIDEGMNKAQAEVIVHGCCYTPGAKPQGVCAARVAIGSVDKTIYAIGDRTWQGGAPTEPEPFTEMPLDWEGAFGGEGYEPNPLGKGWADFGKDGTPLPNVELAHHLIKSPKDEPEPRGLGPIDLTWPQRFAKMGTYDERWHKTRFPGFAEDIDWTVFNAAQPDQWQTGAFEPGAAIHLEHLHPDEPEQQTRLPNLRVRLFVNRLRGGEEIFEEVATGIDTVHLFPHRRRGIAIYRGLIHPHEDDASDLLQLVAGAERVGAPKTEEHYRGVLRERLKPSNPAVLLRDADLMPPMPEGPLVAEEISEHEQLLTTERLLLQNQQRGAQKRVDALRTQLEDAGMDSTSLEDAPPVPDQPSLDELADYVDDQMKLVEEKKKDAMGQREEAMDRARAMCEEHGLDFDAMVDEAKGKSGGPPEFTAVAMWERIQQAKAVSDQLGVSIPELEDKLADPELGIKLQLAEEKMKEIYVKMAHLQPPPPDVDEARALELRDDLLMRVAAGIDLAGRDMTGADLSGLRLAGANLSGIFLEGADLSDADLSGAKLDGAVLARAKLDRANLERASLEGANLGLSSLVATRAQGANLRKAEMDGANLQDADLSGAELEGVKFGKAQLAGMNATGAHAPGLIMIDGDFSGTVLRDADLTRGTFLRTRFDDVDLSGATLTSSTFLDGGAARAKLVGAKLSNLRVVKEASFAEADLQQADLSGANFREAKLGEANLSQANLAGADFSGADLAEAKLVGVRAPQARFTKADLSGADLREASLVEGSIDYAKVRGANFEKANLFRADIARMVGDDDTSFEGALLNRVRTVPPRKPEPEETR